MPPFSSDESTSFLAACRISVASFFTRSLNSLRQRNAGALCLVLLAMVLPVFLPSIRNGFVNYDDNLYVTDNPHVKAGLTSASLTWAFTRLHGAGTYWHPLTWVSHMTDSQLYGLRSWGHHLTSVLLHAANSLLVFLVFRKMTAAHWRSFFLAALFALHPLQVDTVAWVAERKNLLSAMFWLLTMWAYLRYNQRHIGKVRLWNLNYLLVVSLFCCGLLCKPVLVTLPFVLLLLDFWPLRRFQPTNIKAAMFAVGPLVLEKLPLFLLAAGSCLITLLSHHELGMLDPAARLPLVTRVANALVSYVRYLGKVVWPDNLAVFYPYPDAWPASTVALCGLLLLVLCGVALLSLRTRPHLLVGWFWFLGVLVPFIGVMQVGAQAMADRFMYVPIIGILMCVVWSAAELAARRPSCRTALSTASACSLVACGLASHFQLNHWQSSITLFSHARAVTRDNALAECNLGNALGAEGHTEAAIEHLREAVRLSPGYAEAHVNFGVALVTMGKLDEGIDHYRSAIKSRPDYPQAHRFLAGALALQHKHDEARAEFLEAIRLKPDYAEAHARLGYLLAQQGRTEEALRELFTAITLRDDCEDGHYLLASALARLGRTPEAVVHFKAALRFQPSNAAALNDLAWILATDHDPNIRNVPEAIRLAKQANEASHGGNPAYLDTLGTALFAGGHSAEAIETKEKAASMAAAALQTNLASQIRADLESYRNYSQPATSRQKKIP